MAQASFDLLIGTYTDTGYASSPGDGLYAASCRDGVIGDIRLVAAVPNPSWLSYDAERAVAYCVSERAEGAVIAVDLNPGHVGDVLGMAPTGAEPAHLVITPDRRFAITADYSGGSVTTIPIGPDGRLGASSDRRFMSALVGESAAASHPHFIGFDPVTGEVAVCDLGLDRVFFFVLGSDGLETRPSRELTLPAGTGPRRLAFSPDGERLFVLGEPEATLSSFRRSDRGFVAESRISVLPDGYSGRRSAAELLMADDGRVAYATHRGDDTVSVIDVARGTPRLVGTVPAGVRTPRTAALTPDDQLLVAGQDDGRIVSFSIDDPYHPRPHTEALIPAPVCVQVVDARR